jgi:hypothetical protein
MKIHSRLKEIKQTKTMIPSIGMHMHTSQSKMWGNLQLKNQKSKCKIVRIWILRTFQSLKLKP